MIDIVILGSAAGGGIPQWNCGCPNCRDARNSHPDMSATQTSIAFTGDGRHWFLINASPDLRHQLAQTQALHPAPGKLRHSPIAGVVLTNGEIDAITGLLTLREGTPFSLYAHERVLGILKANPIFNALKQGIVERRAIALDKPFALTLPNGEAAGIEVTPFAAPGKAALFLEDTDENQPGDTLGLKITDLSDGRSFVFLAACAEVNDEVRRYIAGADLIFFDGTLWRDDELIAQGLGQKTGQRMGHISMQSAIDEIETPDAARKIFLHINNSNPALRRNSVERQRVEAAGWQILADGTELRL